MDEHIKDLENMSGKIQRNIQLFESKLESLIALNNELSQLKDALQLEVTELNCFKSATEKIISDTIINNHPELARLLKEGIAEDYKPILNNMETLLNRMDHTYGSYLKRFQWKGFMIAIAFCLGSLLSGLSLWYFFPQTTVVRSYLGEKHFSYLKEGVMFKHAFKKLSKADQNRIRKAMGDSWKEYYDEIFARNSKKLKR